MSVMFMENITTTFIYRSTPGVIRLDQAYLDSCSVAFPTAASNYEPPPHMRVLWVLHAQWALVTTRTQMDSLCTRVMHLTLVVIRAAVLCDSTAEVALVDGLGTVGVVAWPH